MRRDELDAIYEELRLLMRERLNVRARSFPRAVRRAGRLLPAQARSAAAEMKALEHRLDHPKLAARTDPEVFLAAANRIRESLLRYKPGARAARDRSFLVAEIGAKLALLIAAVLVVVHMQGGA